MAQATSPVKYKRRTPRVTIEFINGFLKRSRSPLVCISEAYEKPAGPLTFRCTKDPRHVVTRSWTHLKRYKGCRICEGTALHISRVEDEFLKHGFRLLSKQFLRKGAERWNEQLAVECSSGRHRFYRSFNHFKQSRDCPVCKALGKIDGVVTTLELEP